MGLNWTQLLRTVFVPTSVQIFVCIGLAILIELIAFSGPLGSLLAEAAALPSDGLMAGFQHIFNAIASVPYVDNSAIVVFWIALGTLVYLATLAIHNSLIDARNSVVLQTEFTEHPSLSLAIGQQLLQVALGLLAIGALVGSGLITIPFWGELCGQVFDPNASWISGLYLLLGLGGLAVNIYVIWMLVLLTLNANDRLVDHD
jgi:hypothetical protein